VSQLDRPTLRETLSHPFLWDAMKKLSFLCLLSDRLKSDRPDTSALRSYVENHSSKVFGRGGWWNSLDELFQNDIYGSAHTYDYNSLCDLLRLIRNKRSHLQELQTKDVRGIAATPTKLLHHFIGERKFPNLIIVCYGIVKTTLAHELEFQEFLGDQVASRCKKESIGFAQKSRTKPRFVSPCRSWYPSETEWAEYDGGFRTGAFSSLERNKQRRKFVTGRHKMQLCKHWERTNGTWCTKGKDCHFAHGMIELRHSRLIRSNGKQNWSKVRGESVKAM